MSKQFSVKKEPPIKLRENVGEHLSEAGGGEDFLNH